MQRQRDLSTIFCILVFGDMGKAGFLSFESILSLNDISVCALTDSAGKDWIKQSLFKLKKSDFICYHPLNDERQFFLGRNKYSLFGTDDFASITIHKWDLIKQTIKERKDNKFIVFSDLDVIWRQKPAEIVDFANDRTKFAAFQDDSNQYGKKFCTGIMLWKNSRFSMTLLNRIKRHNIDLLGQKANTNDEQALNSWYRHKATSDFFYSLPVNKFVIGHNLFSLLINRVPFKFNDFIAFHANYCVGLKNKLRLLKIASEKDLSTLKKLKYLMILSYVKLNFKLKH
jgi:hypothetical protein